MSRSHKKLAPIGCNMNDAGYPFRGEYKLEDVINHGHSGVVKKVPTSLSLKISGSNLVIEQLQAPKSLQLACELAVDGGVPRAVALGKDHATTTALAVPGDGREYQVTAVVKNEQGGKHFCRMTFNGSEGQGVVRVRAPPMLAGRPDALQMYVDGKRVLPVGGWFAVPLRAADCSLVLDLAPDETFPGSSPLAGAGVPRSFLGERRDVLPQLPGSRRASDGVGSSPLQWQPSALSPVAEDAVPAASSATVPSQFLLETFVGDAADATLQCAKTGETFTLRANAAAMVPVNAGPYRLRLPKVVAPPLPAVSAVAPPTLPGAFAASPSTAPAPVTQAPLSFSSSPPALPSHAVAPTIEMDAQPAMVNGQYVYTVTAVASAPAAASLAPSLNVQLSTEGGAVAAGVGRASLVLPHRSAQKVHVTIADAATGAVYLLQRVTVPGHQAEAAELTVLEEPGTGWLTVKGRDGARVSATPTAGAGAFVAPALLQAAPVTGSSSVRVDRSRGAQSITVEQPNGDGSVSSARLTVGASTPAVTAQTAGGPPAVALPFAVPSNPADSTASQDAAPWNAWASALAAALQSLRPEEAGQMAGQTASTAPSPAAARITAYVREQLLRQPLSISFATVPGGVANVQCTGGAGALAVTASVDNTASAAGQPVPPNGTVRVVTGATATLTMTSLADGRPAGSLRVTNNAAPGAGAGDFGPGSAYPSGTTGMFASHATALRASEEDLIARLVDCLQRHNLDATRVADELAAMPASSLPPSGQRLVPLLAQCMRRASALSKTVSAGGAGDGAAASDEFFFTCGNGCLTNIYTRQPQLQLTASVDGRPAAPLEQRGRVPSAPGTRFAAEGQPHFVRLVARDPMTGEVRKELTLTVMGADERPSSSSVPASASPLSRATGHFSGTPSYTPQPPRAGEEDSAFAAPSGSASAPVFSPTGDSVAPRAEASAPGSPLPPAEQTQQPAQESRPTVSKSVPYLDVSLQQMGQDVQLRCATRTGQRIACDIDGLGGDTGLSDFTTRMHGARHHRVELSVVDAFGQVTFQQRLELPAMSSSQWGVALQAGGVAVDPDGGCVTTVSMDRAPERAVQGNYLTLDTGTPHFIVLRKYLNGVHGVKAGELGLRLPALLTPTELEALTRLYRARLNGDIDEKGLEQELRIVQCQSATPAVRALIDALVETLVGRGSRSAPVSGGLQRSSSRVYFRLTGTD